MKNNKYYLECHSCGNKIEDFKEWFDNNQQCPKCGNKRALVRYYQDISALKELL